jgi:hypothetical protein
MNEKPVQERTLRVIAVAAGGFAALLMVAPDWARTGLFVFGVIYAAMACVVDENVRNALRRSLDSRLRGNDITKARGKSPAARRAAT